ncbi:MAG TPA: amidase [Xanthobacteraceae bacterium]|nr:amidase [Xanthobacteraceae bacterium]
MSAPDPSTAPRVRPFLSQAARFANGADTPSAFLQSCLSELDAREPKVGAFVTLSLDAARAAAERSTARWRSGTPQSAIDGMPIGVKDIIETADMPTEMGSPLFAGWRSYKDAACVSALRSAGAVIVGKTVTTEFAASEPRGTRNPWNLDHTPGGSSSGSAAGVACGMISAGLGTQVIGSTIRPASYCGVYGFKPTVGALNRQGCHDYQSQSCTGVLAATLEDTWQVAYEIASRVGGDAGRNGLAGPGQLPTAMKPKRLAFLETPGWSDASDAAKLRLEGALARLGAAGVEIRTREDDEDVAAVESEISESYALSNRINSWEMRWFIRGCVERDASKLSRTILERHAQSDAMTLTDYRTGLKERARIRAVYAELADSCDACVTLSASGAAPIGLQSTGSPQFAVPSSLLGVPALSLPLFFLDGMPLGLQVLGYANEDASTFATAAWLRDTLSEERT